MKHVTILAFDYAFATAIIGMADLLGSVGVTWNYIHGQKPKREFLVEIASASGKPIRCANNLLLNVHKSIHQINQTDLLVIPTIAGDITQTLKRNQSALSWIKQIHQTGCDIATNCTGAFMLAETGLLNNRIATTHWGFVKQFEDWYPDVKLKSHELITEDGEFFCSGGGTAWFDMSLFLIERYCGFDVAQASTRSYVFDKKRNEGSSEIRIPGKRYHNDPAIAQLQDWMDKNFMLNVKLGQLSELTHLSERTLKRRFKAATGDSLIQYLQSLRIDAAKRLLEGSLKSIEQITYEVGYEDVSSFIRLFKRKTSFTPSNYRARFSQRIS